MSATAGASSYGGQRSGERTPLAERHRSALLRAASACRFHDVDARAATGRRRSSAALAGALRQRPLGRGRHLRRARGPRRAPGRARAAGTFCAENRFPLVVPCHRVVAANGIGGYGSLGADSSGGCSRSRASTCERLSEDVRAELAAIAPTRGCDRLAELSALFHAAGSVHLRGRGRGRAPSRPRDRRRSRGARSRSCAQLGVPSEIRTYQPPRLRPRDALPAPRRGRRARARRCSPRRASSTRDHAPLERPPRRVVGRAVLPRRVPARRASSAAARSPARGRRTSSCARPRSRAPRSSRASPRPRRSAWACSTAAATRSHTRRGWDAIEGCSRAAGAQRRRARARGARGRGRDAGARRTGSRTPTTRTSSARAAPRSASSTRSARLAARRGALDGCAPDCRRSRGCGSAIPRCRCASWPRVRARRRRRRACTGGWPGLELGSAGPSWLTRQPWMHAWTGPRTADGPYLTRRVPRSSGVGFTTPDRVATVRSAVSSRGGEERPRRPPLPGALRISGDGSDHRPSGEPHDAVESRPSSTRCEASGSPGVPGSDSRSQHFDERRDDGGSCRHQRLRPHRAELLPRAARARARTSRSSRSTTSATPKTMAHLLKYDSTLGPFAGRGRARRRRRSAPAARRSRCSPSATRRRFRGAISASTSCSSRPGFFTERDGRAEAPRRRREEGRHLGAGDRPGLHARARRQRRRLRPGARTTSSRTPRARRTASRRSRRCSTTSSGSSPGFMTTIHAYTNDQSILDLPAQGPAPRARRGDQPDPDLDRRREGDRARAARAQGQGRRHLGARARPDGLAHRPRRHARPRGDRGRGQRARSDGGRRPARSTGSSSTPRIRSSRPTSSAIAVLVHLRQRADDGARAARSRSSAGTTTSGATRAGSST